MVALGPSAPWTSPGDGAERVDPPAPAPAPDRLRVTTFNVEHRTPSARLISAVRSHRELARSDVLLLQEIGPDPAGGPARAAELAAALGLGYAYARGLAIVCRWPLRAVAVMELPRARLPFNQRQRVALAAEISTAGGPLRLMTVHLDTRINAAARIDQLAPAVDAAHPLQIIGGDMNTLPFHFVGGAVPIWAADQRGRLEAYLRGLGFDAPASATRATHRARLRLDALFTRGFVPGRTQVATDVPVSDHFPIWADLVCRL